MGKKAVRAAIQVLALAVVLAAAIVAGIVSIAAAPPASAQDGAPPPAPTGLQASDGGAAGTVALAWDAVDGAAFYRIGWVAMDDIPAAQAAGREWLDAFVFTDVANLGQTTYTIKGLAPGMEYAFIVASVGHRFSVASWSAWVYLTPAASPSSCPTDVPSEPTTPAAPASTPTPTPTTAPTPTPTPSTATPEPEPTPTPTPMPTPHATPAARGGGTSDYDADKDALIEISNLSQLNAIRYDLDGDGIATDTGYAAAFPDAQAGMGCPADGCAGYELMADLDFDTNGNGQIDAKDDYWDDGSGWMPIGKDHLNIFATTFAGNGHNIANLYINRSNADNIGLFGVANPDSDIRNVALISINIYGNYYIGGLVGVNYGKVTASSAAGRAFSSGGNVGGLIGRNSGSIIDSHAATSVIGGNSYVGGLVGNNGGTITASYATGDVDGSSVYISVGGLVGDNGGAIAASYASGNVAGGSYINGGLVGYNHGIIANSYATGSVSGPSETGGLVGRHNSGGIISASYAIGSVSGSGRDVGGLVGRNIRHGYRVISDSYWDVETSGQAHSAAGSIGLTTRELQSPTANTGIYANWSPEYWDFGDASQYPVLKYATLSVAAQRP